MIVGIIIGAILTLTLAAWKALLKAKEESSHEQAAREKKAREEEAKCYLNFDQFKQWYDINPDEWTLCDSAVRRNNIGLFEFNKEDTEKYKQWREDMRIASIHKRESAKMAALLETVKSDIEVFLKREDRPLSNEDNDNFYKPVQIPDPHCGEYLYILCQRLKEIY